MLNIAPIPAGYVYAPGEGALSYIPTVLSLKGQEVFTLKEAISSPKGSTTHSTNRRWGAVEIGHFWALFCELSAITANIKRDERKTKHPLPPPPRSPKQHISKYHTTACKDKISAKILDATADALFSFWKIIPGHPWYYNITTNASCGYTHRPCSCNMPSPIKKTPLPHLYNPPPPRSAF